MLIVKPGAKSLGLQGPIAFIGRRAPRPASIPRSWGSARARDSRALAAAELTLDRIDLFEFNEAFAAQVLACPRELGDRRGTQN